MAESRIPLPRVLTTKQEHAINRLAHGDDDDHEV